MGELNTKVAQNPLKRMSDTDKPEQSAQWTRSVLNALGDQHSRRILSSAIARAMTVEEIVDETKLPMSTTYRRVRQFVDEGLMVMEKVVLTKAGKRYARYRTSFTSMTVTLSGSRRIEVEIKANPATVGRLREAKLLESRRHIAKSIHHH